MPEFALVIAGLALAGAFVLAPLRQASAGVALDDEASAIRHRVALEALRDVESDHAAGFSDEVAHAAQLAEAEADAAATQAALESPPRPATAPISLRGQTVALAAAGVIGVFLAAGSLVPAIGLANATVVNQPLADARAAESARQARIGELLEVIAADPTDADALSDLADAYLGGSTSDDLARAAAALQLLISADPQRADAYERLMSAYLRAGDAANARAVHDSYAEISNADPVELAFFDGIISLRGENDRERALAAFDRFLELAPDDPRAGMIRSLRDGAAGTP
jgi:tetratricopeptide (TPR) repeat protein